ncbi:MAG: hypothetical protein LBQ78_09295 [Tannerellaceae bacterium]|jgi:hypothetical protein|nr:hypothetical protein [Tannerellaceae bacterium]
MNYFNVRLNAIPILLMTVTTLFNARLNAQVTIGMDEAPKKAALLQLKDVSATQYTKNATATTGGLLLPRVELTSLTSFTLPLSPAPSDDEKEDHTGLLVYNLTEDANEHLEKGIYQWDGSQWKVLSKVTKTEGATVRKVIYRGTAPDENQVVNVGIFEFRIDNSAISQFRRVSGAGAATHYWQVGKFSDSNLNAENTDWNNSSYSFDLESKENMVDGVWENCKGNAMGNTERNEVWLADLENDNMYHVLFMILGESSGTKTYLIVAQKY